MKKTATHILKQLISDRPLMFLTIGFIASLVVYCVYVGFSVSATDLQIATRYSAFGETQYYRNKWYYLLNFIGLAVLMAVVHTGLIAKLRSRDMRPQAFGFGFLSLILVMILFLLTHSVLSIAYLS